MISIKCIEYIEKDLEKSLNRNIHDPLKKIVGKLADNVRMYLTEIDNGINDQRDMINLIQKIITNKIEIHKVPLIETEPKHYDIIPRIDLFDNNLKLNGNISFHESSKNNLTQVSDENLLIQLKKILSLLHEYKSVLNNLELKLLLKWHVLYWCISLNRILEISQIEKKYLGEKTNTQRSI